MKATSVILPATRFPVEWPDDPDSDPPPGREPIKALLDELLASGRAQASAKAFDHRDYENSAWFFRFKFEGGSYWIWLDGSFSDRKPGVWRVRVTRDPGFFRLLFSRGDSAVPDDCLQLLQECICRVFAVDRIEWISSEEADREFAG